jgi:hypothetical protein
VHCSSGSGGPGTFWELRLFPGLHDPEGDGTIMFWIVRN